MAMSRNIVLLQPVTSAAFDPAQTRFMRSGNTGAPLDRMKEDITMKDLLPFVERELSLFGDYFRRFAEEYPAIAGELKLQSDSGGDPFIRNLTQAAAVLNARTAKKLDDDYPELTSSFLEILAPHLTRPFHPAQLRTSITPAAASRPLAPRRSFRAGRSSRPPKGTATGSFASSGRSTR